jgi:hypothetical protein
MKNLIFGFLLIGTTVLLSCQLQAQPISDDAPNDKIAEQLVWYAETISPSEILLVTPFYPAPAPLVEIKPKTAVAQTIKQNKTTSKRWCNKSRYLVIS